MHGGIGNSSDRTWKARLQPHLLSRNLIAFPTGGVQVHLLDKVRKVSQLLVVPVVHQTHALVFVGAIKDGMGHGANKTSLGKGSLMQDRGDVFPLLLGKPGGDVKSDLVCA